jgi:hypothetical protein
MLEINSGAVEVSLPMPMWLPCHTDMFLFKYANCITAA